MKVKEIEALRNQTAEELKAELRQTREKQFSLSFKHTTTPLTNPLELRQIRRRIALINTLISEKEIGE
ncbi:MAG: 50S ribosomal protein L29 [Elusimicrobiaceae bacterium]|jgi:large subunit ribosomal protein L29